MSRPHPLLVAAGLFSVIPMPATTDLQRPDAAKALSWFWPLGALLGLAAGGVSATISLLSGTQLLAAVITVVVLQALVGAMHLDGLADTLDGLAALGSRKDARDKGRALEIMRQPDIGAAGVVAIVCVLLAQVAALASAQDARSLFVLALLGPMVGRLVVLVASRRGVPAAREGGFGALFAGVTHPTAAAVHVVVVAVVAGGMGWWVAGPAAGAGLTISLLVTVSCSAWWTRRLVRVLGGITGDVFGALVELSTALMVVAGALVLAG